MSLALVIVAALLGNLWTITVVGFLIAKLCKSERWANWAFKALSFLGLLMIAMAVLLAVVVATDWRGLTVLTVLFATTYVQIVGKQIELLSGLDRLQFLGAYRSLFGGAPWVQWPMFRWGGLIQIAALLALFLWFGWMAVALTIVVLLLCVFFVQRTARNHAVEMLRVASKVQG